MARKILLDVDTGVDDALAIILASKSTDAQLLAITTVNGNVSLEKATVNTLKVLTLLHKEGDIPVIQGAHAPLRRPCFLNIASTAMTALAVLCLILSQRHSLPTVMLLII